MKIIILFKKIISLCDKYQNYLILTAFMVFAYWFYLGYQFKQKVNKSKCMAIGYTTGLGMEGKLTVIRFYFFIGNKSIKGFDMSGFNLNVKEEGGKYLVKYVCDKPEESRMYFDKPIEVDSVPFEYLNSVE